MIIGTAGHIDHGKTALVKALTGVDTDRLKEEKARGITIDLGFAYLPTAAGATLGFIDVPGHERLVHTMLAGASGIDFALLVVAADDGVMPQTLEHLAIIGLLGVGRGLIALTKADLAPPERIAEVTAQIRDAVRGTPLAGADIVPVSTVDGQGIDALRLRLEAEALAIAQRPAEGRFRLAVDRVFSLVGVGVVVTGTILSGRVRVGDRVLASPSGLAARVRTLHVQDRPAEAGRAGDRCALNLAGDGVTKEAIHRGDMILDPALHAPTDRIDAMLHVQPSEPKAVGQWFPVRLHHASVETGARIVLLDDMPIQPGAEAPVQLVLDRPIAAAVPDRYVIRDVSAQRTIGGGHFVDLRPPARKRRTPERQAQRTALALTDPLDAFEALLAVPPYAWDIAAFVRDRALSEETGAAIVDALGLVVLAAGETRIAITPERWRGFLADVRARLADFHAENPDLQGLGREKLRLLLEPRLAPPVFLIALQKALREGRVVLDGAFVRLAEHSARLLPADEALWGTISGYLAGEARFRPPRVRDIAGEIGEPETEIRRVLKIVGRMGRVDAVAHDHFFLRETVREMVAITAALSAAHAEGFSAAQFRDQVNNGRKVAIQILEFLDRHGVTMKRDDLRRINPHRLDLFGTPAGPATDLPVLTGPPIAEDLLGRESSLVGRSDFKSE